MVSDALTVSAGNTAVKYAKWSEQGGGLPARAVAVLLLLACNLCLAVILLSGYPALADLVTPLTGHIIGLGVAAALALIFARHAWRALAFGVALTVGLHAWLGMGASLVSGRQTTTMPTGPASAEISVISLNTWDAVDNVEQLKAYFATAPADVVVLSEIGPPKRALLEALKWVYPYQTDCAAQWHCSLALISRVPFEAAGAVRHAKDNTPAFVWARFAGQLTVVGTHIYRPSRNPWLHVHQADALARVVRNIEGSVVLVGDLNMSPWSYSFRDLKTRAGLEGPRIFTPSWPAWPLPLPQVALDHILISPDLTFATVRSGPAAGSDHLSMFARIYRQPNTVDRGKGIVREPGSRLAAAGAHLDGELLAHLGREHGGPRDLRR